MFPVFPSIKHASLWCSIKEDGFFLFKTSEFLKIDPQKIILRRFEKIFPKIFEIENFGFQKFSKSIFFEIEIFSSIFRFLRSEKIDFEKISKSKISDLKNFRKYFSNRCKIIFCGSIFKNPDVLKRKNRPHSSCTINYHVLLMKTPDPMSLSCSTFFQLFFNFFNLIFNFFYRYFINFFCINPS